MSTATADAPRPVHVYPLTDVVDHILEGAGCICGPRIEDGGMLIIHHSLDGREKKERH